MIQFFKKFTLATLLASVAVGCVKDRPITYVPDPEGDRMLKASFTGTEGDPAYWAYKVTVARTSANDGFTFTGFQSDMKVGYFEFTRDKLKFLNANVSNRNQANIQASPEVLNEWDVTHTENRLAESDGYTTNREEENNYISWREKNYFKLSWENANITEAASFPFSIDIATNFMCWQKRSSELLEDSREITPEHISFTIRVDYQQNSICAWIWGEARRMVRGDYVFSVDYKYSFRRIPRTGNPDYQPYRYTGEDDPLERKYGYFQTVLEERAEDNRYRNVFFMNRWDPNKKHDIYFAEDFPEKYKPVFYETICHANRVFAKHGLSDYPITEQSCRELADAGQVQNYTCNRGICFDLKENTGQKFGDLRYSFFKVIEELEQGPFGYGPSDANPFTGEIISANSMVWTGLLKYYLRILKTNADRMNPTIENEDGQVVANPNYRYERSTLLQKMKVALEEEDHTQWTATSRYVDVDAESRPEFEYLLTKMTYGYPGYNSFARRSNYPGLLENPQSYQQPEADSRILDLSGFAQIQSTADRLNIPERERMMNRLDEAKRLAEEVIRSQSYGMTSIRDSVVYPYMDVLVNAAGMFFNGMSEEEVERRIMVQVALHEFGHNLGLRHNFYGSFDAKNFRKAEHGQLLSKSSSVMDYLDMRDEVVGLPEYEAYDEAALVFAYSNGRKDLSNENNINYMYCTDEHTVLNALCNRHDSGTTPSEVVKSLIERYDERYLYINYRFDRAYWNTNGYAAYVFNTMFQLKKPLMMWRTAFRSNYISEKLNESGRVYTQPELNRITEDIEIDIRQAIKLSIAFYDSVLQQSASVRPWQTIYHEESGAIERLGIIYDKIFAMLFLMGDFGFAYNPNHYLGKASYLTYLNMYGYQDMVEKILENTLTVRVDMEPWFIGLGRILYAINATNYYNRDTDLSLIEKVGVRCYTPSGLRARFGIDPNNFVRDGAVAGDELDTDVVSLENYADRVTDPYYRGSNEYLGITRINGNYYVASSTKNKYAYTIIDNMRRRDHNNENPLGVAKFDVQETYLLYNLFTNFYVPQTCDDGSGVVAPAQGAAAEEPEAPAGITPVGSEGI